jgi:hypothetical protein
MALMASVRESLEYILIIESLIPGLFVDEGSRFEVMSI